MKYIIIILSVICSSIIGCTTTSKPTIQRPFKRSPTIDTIITTDDSIIIHRPRVIKPQIIKPNIIRQ